MAKHRIRKGTKKVAKGAVDIAKQATGEAIGKMATSVEERTEERLFDGKPRGRLLAILSKMDDKDTENLWRHHREALEDDDPTTEDRFIYNLTKLLGEGRGADERCGDVLKWLNGLEDDQFEQAIELLEHDAVAQVLQKIKLHTWETVRDILIKAAGVAEKAVNEVANTIGKVKETLSPDNVHAALTEADVYAAEQLDKVIEWMDGHDVKRHVRQESVLKRWARRLRRN